MKDRILRLRQGYLLASMEAKGADPYADRAGKLFALEVLKSFHAQAETEEEPGLSGNEFRRMPPTGAGERISRDSILSVLKAEKYYTKKVSEQSSGEDELKAKLLKVISSSLDCWFLTNGVNRQRAGLADKAETEKAEARIDTYRTLYERSVAVCFRKTEEEGAEKAVSGTEDSFVCRQIPREEAGNFFEYIPGEYHGRVRRGSIAVTVLYEKGREDKPAGVFLTRACSGWLELLYSYRAEGFEAPEQGAALLRSFMESVKSRYEGAYCERYFADETEREMFSLSGMEVMETDSGIYEIPLSEIKEKMPGAADPAPGCVFIKDLTEDMLELAADFMESDPGPLPVPAAFCFDWDSYIQELSLIYMEEGKPAGILLFSETEEGIAAELCRSRDKRAVSVMAAAALAKALELYPEDRKLIITLPGKAAEALIQKLKPELKAGRTLVAVKWF